MPLKVHQGVQDVQKVFLDFSFICQLLSVYAVTETKVTIVCKVIEVSSPSTRNKTLMLQTITVGDTNILATAC